jgi:amino-acid N-acetyltransferase
MTAEIVKIERATPESLGEVLDILSRENLPRDGVEDHFGGFLVARDGGGKILGCAGLERHGDIALLRSAAVLPEHQGRGVGRKLIRELLDRAASGGVAEVALLTTTAKDYFETGFGFAEAERSRYQSRLANSPEWNLPRCSSAAFMTLKLKPDDGVIG